MSATHIDHASADHTSIDDRTTVRHLVTVVATLIGVSIGLIVAVSLIV